MTMGHALSAASPSWLERHRRHLLWLVVALVVGSALEVVVASFLDESWIGLLIAAGVVFASGAPTEPSLKRWPLLRMARSTALTLFRSVRRAITLGRWD